MSAVVCEHNPELKLDAELQWILGQPGFRVRVYAELLRATGALCARRHEDEQAVAIHWMLKLYLQHGPEKWRGMAQAEAEEMQRKVIAQMAAKPEAQGA